MKRAIKTNIELIGRYPDLGRPAGEGAARVLAVARYPYLLYWVKHENAVLILHIRDARRETALEGAAEPS